MCRNQKAGERADLAADSRPPGKASKQPAMRPGPWALTKLICESVGCSGEILQVSSSPGGVPVPSAQDHDVARVLWNGPAAPTTVRRWARPQELSCVDP